MLVNPITNALKYSPAGSEVQLEACDQGGGLQISVTDHGQCIAAEDLPRLFQRFARARGTRQEGVGLGLYILRLLVEAYSGSVSATSAPAAAVPSASRCQQRTPSFCRRASPVTA